MTIITFDYLAEEKPLARALAKLGYPKLQAGLNSHKEVYQWQEATANLPHWFPSYKALWEILGDDYYACKSAFIEVTIPELLADSLEFEGFVSSRVAMQARLKKTKCKIIGDATGIKIIPL